MTKRIPKSISARLRILRSRARLTTRELDLLAGLGAGHTSMIEGGHRTNPETNTLRGLASALGVSLDWLVNGIGPEPTAEQILAAVSRARLQATGT